MTARPLTIAMAERDVALLQSEQAARAAGKAQPMNIRLLLDELSQGGVRSMAGGVGVSDAMAFVYHFDRAVVARSLTGRPFTFLVWGLPARGFLRDALARFILRRASMLLANDADSAAEAARWSARSVEIVPYFIDTDFFSLPDPHVDRESFFFCPSSNGRDPALLRALADRGHRIVWLNNDARLAQEHGGRSPNLTIVSRPDFEQLRRFYQTCRACILPIRDMHHAAGQTTALEALACGAPVFITSSRTSRIFEPDRLVTSLPANDAALWEGALARDEAPDEARRRRSIVEAKFSVSANRAILRDLLSGAQARA